MRCYHRATGRKVDLQRSPIGSAEFFAECDRIARIAEANKVREARPGTLGALIEIYFRTEHFRNLASRTQKDYRDCASFLAPISDTPVSSIDTPLVAGIHDRAAEKIGWRRANMLRTFMSQVFRFNVPKGLIDRDFAEPVIPKPRPRSRGYANRPWTAEEQFTVLDRAEPHVRVAIALMMHTGLDPSDALKLRRDRIEAGTIWGLRGKTGEEIAIAVGPTLQAALDAAPRHDAITVLASSRGKPWTYNGFTTVWHRLKTQLEQEGAIGPGLTLKGLRHTVATTLREAGVPKAKIADLLGQRTESMAGHYSRSADLANRNRETVETLEAENERRRKIVKPLPKGVKPT